MSGSVTLKDTGPYVETAAKLLPGRPAASPDARLRRVVQIIETESPRTVRDLAAKVNLSPSYLQHLFKQQVGVCITRVLSDQRLQRAARLLLESDMSIKEIAHAVGYGHASSFIRAFQNRFTEAPRAYRQRIADSANTTAVSVNYSSFRS
jgi:AraC-like DNA-binding protein